jgi:hypothetical protein
MNHAFGKQEKLHDGLAVAAQQALAGEANVRRKEAVFEANRALASSGSGHHADSLWTFG